MRVQPRHGDAPVHSQVYVRIVYESLRLTGVDSSEAINGMQGEQMRSVEKQGRLELT